LVIFGGILFILKFIIFRFKILEDSIDSSGTDGLNSLNYIVDRINKRKLFTHLIVNYQE